VLTESVTTLPCGLGLPKAGIFLPCFWQINHLLAGKVTILKLIASLFVIPLFLGIDQWGQRLLKVASGELPETIDLSGDDREDEPDTPGESTLDAEEKPPAPTYVPFVKRLFRIVLVVAMFFLILRLSYPGLLINRAQRDCGFSARLDRLGVFQDLN